MTRWLWSEVRLFRSRGVQAIIPTVLTLAVSGLALTLIVGVIARSPYTHGNLSPQGYERTELVYVGQEYSMQGIGLADPDAVLTGDPEADGFFLFFQFGCASCHGLSAGGGPVAPDLPSNISASKVRKETRDGPKGMPAYSESTVSDEAIESIIAFLRGQ